MKRSMRYSEVEMMMTQVNSNQQTLLYSINLWSSFHFQPALLYLGNISSWKEGNRDSVGAAGARLQVVGWKAVEARLNLVPTVRGERSGGRQARQG